MLNLNQFLRAALWISYSVLAIDFWLVLFILRRRVSRWMYFKRKDAATKRFRDEVNRLIAGERSPLDLAATLRSQRYVAERDAIRDLLLEGLVGDGREAVTEALFQLDYVAQWAQEAFGRSRAKELIHHIVDKKSLPPARRHRFTKIRRLRLFSIKRARAVNDLARLDAPFAKFFMEEALSDPSPFVARANIAAMGHNPRQYELPFLLGLLKSAIQGSNNLALAPLKNALVRYPMGYLDQFIPLLDDPNPLCRFAIVDCIGQVCNAAPHTLKASHFPEQLYRWFVEEAPQDTSVEVQSRSARVIRHFHDAAAVRTLRVLLRNENEFVRLHAVRACADPYYSELVGDIAKGIIDMRWRVREASVKTLSTFGKTGRRHLAHYFLDTSDQFASEQIIEQMERSGVIFEMVSSLGEENDDAILADDVCAKMVRMGRTALLTDLLKRGISPPSSPLIAAHALSSNGNEKSRERLLELLLAMPTPELTTVLQSLEADKQDRLSCKAQMALESLASGHTSPVEREVHA